MDEKPWKKSNRMKYEVMNPDSASEVQELFISVLSHSEGRAEGGLIGNLAAALQNTTKPDDLFAFVARDGQVSAGGYYFHAGSSR